MQIPKNRRVTVRSWQGKILVDIREFYMKDGKHLPGKKGLSPIILLFAILFTGEGAVPLWEEEIDFFFFFKENPS